MLPNHPVLHRRVEAFALFIAMVVLYRQQGHSAWLFVLLFFLPDLPALAYIWNQKWGGVLYNLSHWLVWPIALGAYGFVQNEPLAQAIAMIWAAHIAFDRMLGWGLKTGGSFYDTDMGVKHSPLAKKTG